MSLSRSFYLSLGARATCSMQIVVVSLRRMLFGLVSTQVSITFFTRLVLTIVICLLLWGQCVYA